MKGRIRNKRAQASQLKKVGLARALSKLGYCSRSRAAELIAEEMSLRELRKARKLTQTRVAKTLGITQDSVSRLEKRSDLLLSTLRKTVKAMGGDVRIVAQFPDRAPVRSRMWKRFVPSSATSRASGASLPTFSVPRCMCGRA